MPTFWMDFWTNAAGNWTNGVRGFWEAEMQRQQQAMMNEAANQALQSWVRAWTVLPFSMLTGRKPVASPLQPGTGTTPLTPPLQPWPVVKFGPF
jgi:hypothetical protein